MQMIQSKRNRLFMVALLSGLFFQGASLAQLDQSDGSVEAQSGTATPSVVYPDRGKNKKQHAPVNKPSTEPVSGFEKNFQSKYGVSPQKKVISYLKQFRSQFPSLSRSRLMLLKNKQLQEQFPESIVYVLRFMQWPVAVPVPQGLSSNTILVINKEGKISKILDEEDLKKFFNTNLKPCTTEKDSNIVLSTWLCMAKEFAQDGMYQFEQIDNKSFKTTKSASGITASGSIKIIPRGGNEGEISSVLNFDKDGKIDTVKISRKMQPGIRPICQSRKLLDKDPVVRRMAEQDLLVMGKMCKNYLFEQRELVSPELQKAIDDIWSRILKRN